MMTMKDEKGLFIVAICATIFLVGVALIFLYSYIKFRKRLAKATFASPFQLWIIFGIQMALCLLITMTWIYGTDTIGIATKDGLIALLATNIGIMFGLTIYIVFCLEYIAIKIDDVAIYFIGEKINVDKITKFEINNVKNTYVIYYNEGKRLNKKCSLRQKSLAGKFLFANKALFNVDIHELKEITKAEE